MHEFRSVRRTLRPNRGRLATVLASAALAVGCASSGGGGADLAGAGSRPEAVGIGTTAGARGTLDLTVEASVAQRSVQASPREVWAVMPAVMETLGIEVESFDARQAIIGNVQFEPSRLDGQRLSRFLNCGNSIGGPNADRYRVTAYFMVQLEGAPDGGTTVTTMIDAYARPRSVSGNAVHCTSRGALEGRVQELIEEALGRN